nr:alpha/beta hydrolase [Lachnospiraceae bacterium]
SYNYILDMGISPENIIIAGDSAGGGLSLALTLYLKDHDMPLPAAVITMSAWTDLTKSGSSYDDNYETDPLFGNTRESLVYSEDYYKNTTPDNPYVSPKFGDFTGFPPVLMQVGEMEMLLSDTTDVAKKMEDTGVKVKSHIYPGMFHVFQLGLNLFPEEKEAWNEIEEYINEIWDI